ncbi:MAG: hypothetical protein WBD20_27380 [Pirellulaceae bacterium]
MPKQVGRIGMNCGRAKRASISLYVVRLQSHTFVKQAMWSESKRGLIINGLSLRTS